MPALSNIYEGRLLRGNWAKRKTKGIPPKNNPEADPYVLPAISEGAKTKGGVHKTQVYKLFLNFRFGPKNNPEADPDVLPAISEGAKTKGRVKNKSQ